MRAIFVFFGGQRQWARLALALAQGASVPLLDEPTTFLDPAHAISVLELVRKQARAGKTVVVVLHDHMLAGQYSDTRAVMNNGEVIARGTPKEALRKDILAATYGIDVEIWDDPFSDAPRHRFPRCAQGLEHSKDEHQRPQFGVRSQRL